ncbi:MAG: hypothetical protein ABIH37_01525 [archaeon]
MTNNEINKCKQLLILAKGKKNKEKILEKYSSAVYKKAEKEIEFERLSNVRF